MIRTLVLGRSVEERPICAYVRGDSARKTVLVLGGFHGDEPKSVRLSLRFVELLRGASQAAAPGRWVVIPLVNPDGLVRRKRRNARGVDLNRNFPTKDFAPGSPRSRMFGGSVPASEPETRAVLTAVRRFRPGAIVTIHSIGAGRFCNNFDGPARALAQAMARRNGYPVRGSIGYPTPGSFGTWAGREHLIPTVTLELPSHHSTSRCVRDNLDAVLCAGQWVTRRHGDAAGLP
ncbi:MAG: DUF2817 domain-containing protein [Planctomycetes bacterium]|nr:DUF2817 domain-containing protein [Planctomycetota bacterium]